MLRYQIRNLIFTPATAVSILGLYLFMFISLFPGGPNQDLIYNYQYAVTMGYGSLFIPIVSVIPLCAFLRYSCSDTDRVYILTRSKLSRFTGSTVFCAMLSGMFITFCVFCLFTLTCILYSPYGPVKLGLGVFETGLGFGHRFYGSFQGRELSLLTIMGMIYTINGAIWPMISLLCFSYTQNKYVVAAVPFVFKTLLGIIADRIGWYYLDPGQLMLIGGVAGELPVGGIPYAFAYIGVAALLCGTIWTVRTYRGVRYA